MATAHRHGDVFHQLLKCRYAEFKIRRDYQVADYNGMEYDQYDTPAAVYLAWKDSNGVVRAGIRLTPTIRPYMIKDLWPRSVTNIMLPESAVIWEATRLFIDHSCNKNIRRCAHGHILCGILEFGLYYGIKNYIATAAPKLWNFTFRKCGWAADPVGPVININCGEQIQTRIMHVSEYVLNAVREAMHIPSYVLSPQVMARDSALLVDPTLLAFQPLPSMRADNPVPIQNMSATAPNPGPGHAGGHGLLCREGRLKR